MARPCDTLPKKWCAASIISLDEYWFAVGGGGNGGWEVGAGGGIVPVVWAMTDMDATTAITLAIPATRKLNITAAPRQPPGTRE
jgi:hypothetical protein